MSPFRSLTLFWLRPFDDPRNGYDLVGEILGTLGMSARQPGPYDCIAYKWLALLTRRQMYFMQLADSDRWKRYYTHAELKCELQETVRLQDQWANIAGIAQREAEETNATSA
jgi:hypothetical protein